MRPLPQRRRETNQGLSRRELLSCMGMALVAPLATSQAARAAASASSPNPAKASATPRFTPWKGGATPELSLKDTAGREHTLQQYRGKVVLVNFWATWCEPCREEMPSLEELQTRLKSKPFVVLAVNMEESDAKVARFLQSSLLQSDSLTILHDRFGHVAKAWQARMLPVSFLVGADGRMQGTLLGAANWTSAPIIAQIEKLLPATR